MRAGVLSAISRHCANTSEGKIPSLGPSMMMIARLRACVMYKRRIAPVSYIWGFDDLASVASYS
jgi:hypothetical protein